MSGRTLLVLFVLVGVLGALWLARERETLQGGPALADYPLAPGLAVERVHSVRIDHLERGFQLELERDAAGRWYLTDPLAYPAQATLVRTLLQDLERARAEPAPEADPAQVGLEPPAVVIECRQTAGSPRELVRVELGGLDLDPGRVYVRVPGHPAAASGGTEVFRTRRSLHNTLERNPDDYRDPRVSGVRAQEVVALRRKGLVYDEEAGGRVGIDFEALLGPDGWKRVGLPTVSLDPSGMGLLARGATDLTIERFVDDSPDDLTIWGLDEPEFTLEVEALSQEPVLLLFGCGDPDAPVEASVWYCMRAGFAHVWQVETRDVQLLTQQDDMFFDQLLVRALREDVQRIELEGGGSRRVLTREKKGWSVHEVLPGGVESTPVPAEEPLIEEALGLLERTQLGEHLEGEAFEPADPPLSFTLVLRNDALVGGAVGRAARDPASGAEGRQYLRLGDEVPAVVPDDIAELCLRPLADFRSLRFQRIKESQVRSLELTHAGRTFTYVNDGDNLWKVQGASLAAPPELLQSLDALLNLAVEEWLAEPLQAEPVLAVHLIGPAADPIHLAFVPSATHGMVCQSLDGRAARVDPGLVERLLGLF